LLLIGREDTTGHIFTEHMRVAWLVPEDAATLLADWESRDDGLPTDKVEIVSVAHDQPVPTDSDVKAVCWVPPTKPTKLVEFLDANPQIEWVHSFAAGVDGLSLVIKERLVDSPIVLTNGRGAFSSSLAEYVIAAMFHFNKQFRLCEENRRKRKWDKFTMDTVGGMTMVFVGFGHIAKSTAALAAPLGLNLVALRRNPSKASKDDGIEAKYKLHATYGPEDAAAFYAQCDFVVCSLPLTDETRASIGDAAFAAMKPSAILISLGRGAVIDEAALYKALSTRQIAGAACDVFAKEPLPDDSPLWSCDNLLLTAHNADFTKDYFDLGVRTWQENLECFLKKEPMATPVDKASGY
jgi:phosphoglycerate dehydrogenase-like enzyme